MSDWTVAKRAKQSATVATVKRDFHWTDEELIAVLREVAANHGRCTTDTYQATYLANKGSIPCSRTYVMRFGSWANALDIAGLPTIHPKPYSNRIPDTVLWEAVFACASETPGSGIPSVSQYEQWALKDPARPCVATIRHRLGGWGEILRVLGDRAVPA